MLKRSAIFILVGMACAVAVPGVAHAQQSLNLSVGSFTPRGEDARVDDDVINANRNFLAFEVEEFAGASVGGEWLAPIGDYFEVGAGLGFYRRTVPSVYAEFVDVDGSEIAQDLRLRIVPITATARVLFGGRGAPVQPYIGAGIGLFNWRYSEVGEFVDFSVPGRPIFREQYVADGNAVGPVALGGIRFPIGNWTAGGEVRYSQAKGEVGSDFAGNDIDLGGWTYQFTLGVRFD